MKLGRERGVSLSGLLVVLVVLGALALLAIKTVPAFIEYRAVKDAIARAKATGGSVREIQQAFDKTAGVNDVTAITGRDLVITRDNGEVEVSFEYEKRIPLAGNATLLLDFSGTTDKSGVVASKSASADK
jgi:hypothetical protein